MIELPAALTGYLATVRDHYLRCYRDAIAQAVKRKGPADQVLVEATLGREGHDDEAVMFDVCELGADGTTSPSHVVHRSFAPWPETEYKFGPARLTVYELVWFSVTLMAAPARDAGFLTEWFAAWHSANTDVDRPLSGRVHFVAYECRDDRLIASIDLGSAPVEAVHDLISRSIAAGAGAMLLYSDDDALAGTAPA